MPENIKTAGKMISIWTWVGIILGFYGAIITAMGVYYVFTPETLTATASYNPSLWWGIIMLIASAAFLITSLMAKQKADAND